MQTVKTLIRLGRCPDWSESSLGAHAISWVLSWCGSFVNQASATVNFHKYHNFPKYSDTQKICYNHSKIRTMWLYHRVTSPNNADGMANRVDPDQTAPLGADWSGSALFAQVYLSENLGSLPYFTGEGSISQMGKPVSLYSRKIIILNTVYCYEWPLLPSIIYLGRLCIASRFIFNLWQLRQGVNSLAQWLEHWIFVQTTGVQTPPGFIPVLRLSCRKMGLNLILQKEEGVCYEWPFIPSIIYLGRLRIASRFIFNLWQLCQGVDS